jgi:translation initiation factor 3 subunit C
LRETHVGLCELMSVNRVRELLAQGISSQQQRPDRSKEQEALERKRMMPYHMYINMEMIECVYYVSAMFQETPYLAASDTEVRRRMISKHFHRALKQSENNNLNGPPESLRDHIVAATKAMRYRDWRKTSINLINEKMNVKVWDLFFRADKVKAMLKHKIKEECLRCYLLTYSSIYDSISLTRLVDMFHLPSKLVRSIVCKLICGDEYHIQEDRGKRLILMGSLNEPTQCLIMHRGEPSRVTTVVSQLTEKLCSLSECTERLAECKAMIPSANGQTMTNIGGQHTNKRVNFARNLN